MLETDILLRQDRLRVLSELALLDATKVPLYDRLTELAGKAVGAPLSLLSMVAADHQFFKSDYGLNGSIQQTPLSHSFCQTVVRNNAPLIVSDARRDDAVKDIPDTPELNIIGYLGMPLVLSDGRRLGAFCVIDHEARVWTETETEIVRELAAVATAEIDLRAQLLRNPELKPKVDAAHAAIDDLISVLENLPSETPKEAFLDQVRAARAQFNV
jgi:GAF domain-containing protein